MIVFDEYAGEKHLVEEFILYTRKKPIKLLDEERRFFVWGYEIWLPEGGKNNGPGRIDMIATDQQGTTWLIEAKHSLNFELSPNVWEGQILPYRRVLAKTAEDDILWQTRRYLTGRAEVSAPFAMDNGDSLLAAFQCWLKTINQGAQQANGIYQKVLADIRHHNIVSVLLADAYRSEVWEGRPRDGKGYAYFACSGIGDKFKVEATWDSIRLSDGLISVGAPLEEKTWADIEKETRQAAPAPETLRPMLTDQAVKLYDQCLEYLTRLGWDGKYLQNKKSFVVTLPTRFGLPIRVSLGLPDYDAKSHTLENRLAGGAGFKCDISLKALLRDSALHETGLSFAKRLIREANYRARGAGQMLGTRELTAKEMNDWDGDLHHWTAADERDFIGRADDIRDMEALFAVLRDLSQANISVPVAGAKPLKAISATGEKDNAAALAQYINAVFVDDGDMKKLFATMNMALAEANLKIVYAGAKETVEIRLPDPKYPYAFGSIQYCHPKSGEYLELRFKRVHLQHVGLLNKLDELRDNQYRNDVASATPEAVRFQFRQFDMDAVAFIEKVADIVRQ